ncbi:MAG: sugar phosphate isomerase/epimerase family protein [Trueperaceae bacterium]
MLQGIKKGINQWSFPDTMDLRSCFSLARDAGFDGVELVVADVQGSARVSAGGGAEHLTLPMTYLGFYPYANPEFTLESTAEEVKGIRELADEFKIAIPSLASVMPFIYALSDPDQEVRRKGRGILATCLGFAGQLGAESLLVIPGLVTPASSYDSSIPRVKESVEALIPVAEEHGVVLALENVWNQFFLSPPEFRDFIDSFDSDFVKAYFDVGNVVRTGIGEHWLRTLGKRVDKIHFCNFRGEVGNITGFTRHLLDGDVNWPSILGAMDAIGYSGWVTAEITPPAPHYPEKVIYDIASTMDWMFSAYGGEDALKGRSA